MEKSLCARKDSSAGTVIEWTSSHSFEPSLFQAKIEKDAGASVSQSASAELIFSGCCSYMSLPCQSPVIADARRTRPATPTRRAAPSGATPLVDVVVGCPASFRRRRCHSPMPTSSAPATMSARDDRVA